jgi:hypothetical protein
MEAALFYIDGIPVRNDCYRIQISGGKFVEIYINEEKIDFTLENEKNLGQVIESIENWLKNSELVITSLKHDDRELSFENREQWSGMGIDSVTRLSITVRTPSELHIATCENVLTFFTLLARAMDEHNETLARELSSGFPFVIESLRLVFDYHNIYPVGSDILDIERIGKSISQEGIDAVTSPESRKTIDRLVEKTTLLLNELTYPIESLRSIMKQLEASIAEISEVSILLQTGKDKKAFDTIVRFSELFQSLLRIFTHIKTTKKLTLSDYRIGESNLEEYYNNLNRTLKELHDAFTINDFVLIGDILEYEIAPKISDLIRFMEKFDGTPSVYQ